MSMENDMNADRRLLTPIAGTVLAGFMIAAATLGGSMAETTAAPKGDRFAVVANRIPAADIMDAERVPQWLT